jgi:DNA-binding IclR family transcriptional regulator
MKASESNQKPRVQSAARVVEILQLVSQADSHGISATVISEKLAIPRQVIYHLAHTLVSVNMLRKVGRGTYLLGLGAAVVAEGFRRQIGTGDFATTFAEKAAKATGETAYVVGWIEDEIVVLATARGSGVIQAVEVPRGTAGDAHARASGKLMLAMASNEAVNRYLKGHNLRRRTPNTITARRALVEELARIRKNGYAIDREEYELGLSCLAVPIGRIPSMMVLSVSAPTARFKENVETYLKSLRALAAEIS